MTQKKTFKEGLLYTLPLVDLFHSEENVRLFIERERLSDLVEVYDAHKAGFSVTLPDPPVVRPKGKISYEILAGARRVEAAREAGLTALKCRVVNLSDEEAFDFILQHNRVVPISTVERAHRAAEMDRLGYSTEQISAALDGAGPSRYIEVGRMVDRSWFSDDTKLCDPGIVEWWEAAQYGARHFETCFHAWNSGMWDASTCAREFRRRGKSAPIDIAERGLRITFDRERLIFRGQVNLEFVERYEAIRMLSELRSAVDYAIDYLRDGATDFGPRHVMQVLPRLDPDAE